LIKTDTLVLTDVQMPGELDGVDLAAHARMKKPGLPIVFVTGRREREIQRPLGTRNFSSVRAAARCVAVKSTKSGAPGE